MSKVFQDECLKNLFLAQEAMKEWIPMSEYEFIFEATEKSETAEKVAKNEETAKKSSNFLKKAIDVVIGLIKKLIETIGDFINRCTMSGDERDNFEAFKAQVESDPTLKNKKVTVRDFRKISKQYDDLITEIDKNIRAVKNNESTPVDGLVKKVTDFMKGTATKVSVTVAAETALRMADSNIDSAKVLREVLRREEGVMETLSKALGKKDAMKFEKEINAAAKNTLLHRLKVRLFRHKYDSLADCIKGTVSSLTGAGFHTAEEYKRLKKMAKDSYKDGAISKEEYKSRTKEYNEGIKRAKAEQRSTVKLGLKFVNDPQYKPIVKTVMKAAVNAKVDLTKEQLEKKIDTFIKDHITDRDFEKRNHEGIYKTAFDFWTGR